LKYIKHDLNNIEEILLNSLNVSKSHKELVEKEFLPYLYMIRDKNVNRIINGEFFAEVSELKYLSAPPQTLLKDHRYKQIFSAYLDLIKGLRISNTLEELLKDPIMNMPDLYEYWCFLKIWKILEDEILSPQKGEFKNLYEKSGMYDVLKEKCLIKFGKTKLHFNKTFSSSDDITDNWCSYSVGLRPDFSIETEKELIIFDAKYKKEWIENIDKLTSDEESKDEDDNEEINNIIKEERRSTYKLGDLYKMHTYREAIKRKQNKNNSNRPVWVIALYPGDNETLFYENGKKDKNKLKPGENNSILLTEFLNNIFGNKIINNGGVGAIPLKP